MKPLCTIFSRTVPGTHLQPHCTIDSHAWNEAPTHPNSTIKIISPLLVFSLFPTPCTPGRKIFVWCPKSHGSLAFLFSCLRASRPCLFHHGPGKMRLLNTGRRLYGGSQLDTNSQQLKCGFPNTLAKKKKYISNRNLNFEMMLWSLEIFLTETVLRRFKK